MSPDKEIGREGFIPWLPGSPDLTSKGFYLWETVKSKVYHTPATSQEDMILRNCVTF